MSFSMGSGIMLERNAIMIGVQQRDVISPQVPDCVGKPVRLQGGVEEEGLERDAILIGLDRNQYQESGTVFKPESPVANSLFANVHLSGLLPNGDRFEMSALRNNSTSSSSNNTPNRASGSSSLIRTVTEHSTSSSSSNNIRRNRSSSGSALFRSRSETCITRRSQSNYIAAVSNNNDGGENDFSNARTIGELLMEQSTAAVGLQRTRSDGSNAESVVVGRPVKKEAET